MRDPQTWTQIETLFHQVLELPEEERQAFLKQACSNEDIYQELIALLSSDKQAPTLSSPIRNIQANLAAGTILGPYEIKKVIAQGGMGIVYEAERVDGQFHKKVAIKCLQEFFSPERAQRFFFEKEVLANLDHPNICKMIDAGISEEGQPYFVMDFIDGQNLMDFAKELTLEARLDLFMQVCDAVHYAHQNLVIHRDLKPSNILVDQSGSVFLLDFGISKILNNPTNLTRTMQPVMTPQYASPEQIAGKNISLSTDVYSLGLILFELLTHQRPLKLPSSNYLDLSKTTIDWNVPLPSQCLAQLETSAKAKWKKALQEDVDWVCLKALSIEQEKRYPSVLALKEEIRRFVQGDPVKARKQHRLYTLRKFIAKNRGAFVYASIFLIVIVAFALYHTQKLSRERNFALTQAKKKEQMVVFLSGILQVNNPQSEMGKVLTRQEILELASQRLATDFANEPDIRAELELVLGQIYFQNGLYEESLANAQSAISFYKDPKHHDRSKTATGYLQASNNLIRLNRMEAASKALVAAKENHPGTPDVSLFYILLNEALVAVHENDFGATAALLSQAENVFDHCDDCPKKEKGVLFHRLAVLNLITGDLKKAEVHYKKGMQIFKEEKYSALNLAGDMIGLADLFITKGNLDEAEPLIQEALKIRLEYLEEDHPNIGQNYHFLGLIHRKKGRFLKAEEAYRKALNIRLKHFGKEHHKTNMTQSNLAVVLRNIGKFEEAEALYLATLQNNLKNHGRLHWRTGITCNNLGRLFQEMGRTEEAYDMFCEAQAIFSNIYSSDHHYTGIAHLNLGNNLIETDPTTAEQELNIALSIFEEKLGARHHRVGQVYLGFARLASYKGQAEKAKEWLERSGEIYKETYTADEPTLQPLYLLMLENYEGPDLRQLRDQIYWNGTFLQSLSPFQAEQLESAIASIRLHTTE